MITASDYREAMAWFPSGVTIVTTADRDTVDLPQAGDRTILIAAVEDVQLRPDGTPAVHADRRYWALTPPEVA